MAIIAADAAQRLFDAVSLSEIGPEDGQVGALQLGTAINIAIVRQPAAAPVRAARRRPPLLPLPSMLPPLPPAPPF